MTGDRFPLLPPDEAKAAATDAGVSEYMAEFNIFHALLNHPRLAVAVDNPLTTMLWHYALEARLRQLAIMRIAWLTATDYERTAHWRVSQHFGVLPATGHVGAPRCARDRRRTPSRPTVSCPEPG
jgi:alkylhydroperoxidase family enzyme